MDPIERRAHCSADDARPAKCGPGQNGRDCIVRAGVLIYVFPGVRQSLITGDIFWSWNIREGIDSAPAAAYLDLGLGVTSESIDS